MAELAEALSPIMSSGCAVMDTKIGLDTAQNKNFTGGISGQNFALKQLHKDISKVFAKLNVKSPIHWRIIRLKERKAAYLDVIELYNKSSAWLNIFEHKRPATAGKKDYYLRHLPNRICLPYEFLLKNSKGIVNIEIDDDYSVAGVQNGSFVFAEKFLGNLCYRLSGARIPVRRPVFNMVAADIKFPDSRRLSLFSKVVQSNTSEAVQLADLFLGYYLNFDKTLFDSKKTKYHKI